jgi:membrane associated rhomboid family serine protease
VWVAVRLYNSRLLTDRALIVGAAGWCVTVFALYVVLAWIVDTEFFPHYLLALIAILAIPLARLSAAPLALAWNRHR